MMKQEKTLVKVHWIVLRSTNWTQAGESGVQQIFLNEFHREPNCNRALQQSIYARYWEFKRLICIHTEWNESV